MKQVRLLIFFLLILSGCVKETDWPLSGNSSGMIVVDGILTDEPGIQTIRITHPVSQLNATAAPVPGANVVINDEDSTWQLTETPANSGLYNTPPAFSTVLGKNYSLLIFYQDRVFSAKAAMTAGALFDPLHYMKDDSDDLYNIDFVASTFNTQSSAMWEVLLDWSKVPGYGQADSLACRKRLLFYTLPTLDVSEIFPPEMQKISFPPGTSITERRYSLTPEHAAFIRSLLLETGWQGGLFCSVPANVVTNLSSGATGFFGACAVTTLSFQAAP